MRDVGHLLRAAPRHEATACEVTSAAMPLGGLYAVTGPKARGPGIGQAVRWTQSRTATARSVSDSDEPTSQGPYGPTAGTRSRPSTGIADRWSRSPILRRRGL